MATIGKYRYKIFVKRIKATFDNMGIAGEEIVKALKALIPYDELERETERHVLGVPFGGPIEGRDVEGEAFTPETEIGLLKGDCVNLTYFHGLGPDSPYEIQERPAFIGRAIYAGKGSYEDVYPDYEPPEDLPPTEGHWFTTRLDMTEEYARRIEGGEVARVMASSGAVDHMVRIGKGGLIEFWPVGELALFDTNENRQPANDWAVVVKPKLKKSAGAPEREPVKAEQVKTGAAKAGAEALPKKTNEGKEKVTNIMLTFEEFKEINPKADEAAYQAYVKAYQAQAQAAPPQDEPENEPPPFDAEAFKAEVVSELRGAVGEMMNASVMTTAPGAVVTDAHQIGPHTPEAIKSGAPNMNLNWPLNDGDIDPTRDFYDYVYHGQGRIKKRPAILEVPDYRYNRLTGRFEQVGTIKAAIQEGTDAEGGYLVPAGELGRIIAKRDEVSLISLLGAAQFTTDRDVFNFPTEGTAMTKFTIVAEEGAISAAEEEPTFGQTAATIYDFNKLVKLSKQVEEDYNSGLMEFLYKRLGDAWGITENYYMQVGSGSSQPQGVFVGGTAGLTLDSASAIAVAEIPELIGKLKMAYRSGAKMIMRRSTAAYLSGLTGNQFQLRTPTSANVTADGMDLGIGYPVYPTEDAAAIAASAKTLLFGNFEFYGWVRNRSFRVQRLVELYAGNGQIGLLAWVRAGGGVLQAEAFQYATHPSA